MKYKHKTIISNLGLLTFGLMFQSCSGTSFRSMSDSKNDARGENVTGIQSSPGTGDLNPGQESIAKTGQNYDDLIGLDKDDFDWNEFDKLDVGKGKNEDLKSDEDQKNSGKGLSVADSKKEDGDKPYGSEKGPEDKENDKDKDKAASQGASGAGVCARNWGQTAEGSHISGQSAKTTLTIDKSYSLKITGAQNEVTATVKAASPLDHLCVFMTGSTNKLRLSVTSAVKQMFIVTAGNQPEIVVNVAKDVAVTKANIRMAGNKGTVTFEGEGTHQCEAVTFGSSNTATCKR